MYGALPRPLQEHGCFVWPQQQAMDVLFISSPRADGDHVCMFWQASIMVTRDPDEGHQNAGAVSLADTGNLLSPFYNQSLMYVQINISLHCITTTYFFSQ